MKRFFGMMLVALLCAGTLGAQNVQGNFKVLKGAMRARMVMDFSQADFMGMSEEEFQAVEKDWPQMKSEVVAAVYGSANRELEERLTVGNYRVETPYTLTLIVCSVDGNGNYDCDLVLTEGENELAKAVGIRASGGRVGTRLGLMKDGAENLGQAVGDFLYGILGKRDRRKP